MSEKEKKVKKKKPKEDGAENAAAPVAEESASAAAPAATGGSQRGSSRRAKRAGSSVFSMFTQNQVAEFKEGFQMIDHDKDGVISKNDLRAAFDAVGRLANDKELDEMLNEATGPVNFTQFLSLFANRMSGAGGDEDDVVVAAFKAFDNNGKIDSEKFRHALITWGEVLTENEVDDAFDEFDIDNKGNIDTAKLIALLIAKNEDEEGGEAA